MSDQESNSVSEQRPNPIQDVPEKFEDKIQNMVGVQFSTRHRSQALIDKMEPEHITTALSNADKSDSRQHITGRIQLATGVGGLFILCWLFLAYGAQDHIDAVITGVLGFVGGYGLGLGKGK